jgi:hypothetical protein
LGGAVRRLGGSNFIGCCLELELADGRRSISHHGSSAMLVHDAELHEARGLQVVTLTAALPQKAHRR